MQCIQFFISQVSMGRSLAMLFQIQGWGANNWKVEPGKQQALSKKWRRRKELSSETKKRVREKEGASGSILTCGSLEVMWPRPGRNHCSHGSPSLSAHTHTVPESRNSVWYLQEITNCFREILTAMAPEPQVGKTLHYPLEPSSVVVTKGLDLSV